MYLWHRLNGLMTGDDARWLRWPWWPTMIITILIIFISLQIAFLSCKTWPYNCFTTMKNEKIIINKGALLRMLMASICFPGLVSSNTIIQSTCIFCLTSVVRCSSLYHLAYFRTFVRPQSSRLILLISQCSRSIAQFWRWISGELELPLPPCSRDTT